MKVSDVMTGHVTACTADTGIAQVAHLMAGEDCGMIPVVDQKEDVARPIGTVTDRDIVIRAIAKGRNPQDLSAQDCMTRHVKTISCDADLGECLDLMEGNQLRRMMVVDDRGALVGIVAQADIARQAEADRTGRLVKDVSKKNGARHPA